MLKDGLTLSIISFLPLHADSVAPSTFAQYFHTLPKSALDASLRHQPLCPMLREMRHVWHFTQNLKRLDDQRHLVSSLSDHKQIFGAILPVYKCQCGQWISAKPPVKTFKNTSSLSKRVHHFPLFIWRVATLLTVPDFFICGHMN